MIYDWSGTAGGFGQSSIVDHQSKMSSGGRFEPAGLELVEVEAVRAVDHGEDLGDGLVELGRDPLAHLAQREEHAGDGLVLHHRDAVLGGEGLEALRETILALGE